MNTSALFESNDNYERYQIGDWVVFDKKGYNYTGFINRMDYTAVEIFLVHTQNEKAKVHCGKAHFVEYHKIEPLEQSGLSIEQLKEAIDVALLWKDQPMFDYFVNQLLSLQEQLNMI